MKKLSLIVAFVVTAGVAAMAQTPVYSVNTVGYYNVNMPTNGQFVLVGLNFKDVGTRGYMYLSEVVGTNQLIRANQSANADNVYLYRGNAWQDFYQRANGVFQQVGGVTTNPALYSGECLMIMGSATSLVSRTITICGEVPMNSTISESFAGGAFTLFCNPYSADLNLNGGTIDWTANGASSSKQSDLADNCYFWGGQTWVGYYLRSTDHLWHQIGGTDTNGAVIAVGQGAFYLARGTFTNTYVRPYGL